MIESNKSKYAKKKTKIVLHRAIGIHKSPKSLIFQSTQIKTPHFLYPNTTINSNNHTVRQQNPFPPDKEAYLVTPLRGGFPLVELQRPTPPPPPPLLPGHLRLTGGAGAGGEEAAVVREG